LERARSKLLGSLKQKCSWHDLMMSILLVLNSFMKNLQTEKDAEAVIARLNRRYVLTMMMMMMMTHKRCRSFNKDVQADEVNTSNTDIRHMLQTTDQVKSLTDMSGGKLPVFYISNKFINAQVYAISRYMYSWIITENGKRGSWSVKGIQ